MPKFITSVGELQRKANTYNFIPDFILLANSENKENTEIEIVTLQQAKRDAASEKAWCDYNVHSVADVEAKIEQILKDDKSHFQEFILVKKDKIVVGVDRTVINDSAVDRAIMMLTEMDSFTIDSYKVFGGQN